MKEYVTVIGSRKITTEEEIKMIIINNALNSLGFTLRSGGADGADSTVNNFVKTEIFIPWDGYNNLYYDGERIFCLNKLPDQFRASKKMREIHPNPNILTSGAIKLHTRNIYQIIGKNGADGQKSCLVIYCSDEDVLKDEPIGGTRTAVMFARELNIPTINIREEKDIDIKRIISKMKLINKK